MTLFVGQEPRKSKTEIWGKACKLFDEKVNKIQGSLCLMALPTKNIYHRESKQTTSQIERHTMVVSYPQTQSPQCLHNNPMNGVPRMREREAMYLTFTLGSFPTKTNLATAATECLTYEQLRLMLTPGYHISYQFINSKLLIHPSLTCSVKLELNPIVSPLPATTMFSFVNRRCWSHGNTVTRGTSLLGTGVPLFSYDAAAKKSVCQKPGGKHPPVVSWQPHRPFLPNSSRPYPLANFFFTVPHMYMVATLSLMKFES